MKHAFDLSDEEVVAQWVENREDLTNFMKVKLQGISKMAQSDEVTLVEKKAAEHLIESIEQKHKDF